MVAVGIQDLRAVRLWKRVEIRHDVGVGKLPRIRVQGISIRDQRESCLRQSQSKAFVGEEKKGPTFNNGAAEGATEVVLAFLSLGKRRWIENVDPVEPVIRIEGIVAKIVERGTVKSILPGARNDGNLAPRRAP